MIVAATGADVAEAALRFGRPAAGAAAFAAAPGTLAFVARDGAGVVGWCWGYVLPRPDGDAMAYLHHLEVAADRRRRGVGRGMLEAFLGAAAGRGATRMFLTTGEHNTAARRLYESAGAGLAEQGPTVNYWWRLSR